MSNDKKNDFSFGWVPGQVVAPEKLQLDDEPEMVLSDEEKQMVEDAKKEREDAQKKAEEWRRQQEDKIKSDPNFVPYRSIGEAIKARDLPNTKKMLEMKAPNKDKAEDKDLLCKLLWHVSSLGYEEFLEVLVGYGADVSVMNGEGIPPFVEACAKGFVSTAKELVRLGASTDIRDLDGKTPLLIATGQGQFESVKYLVEEVGVPIDAADLRGFTPLCMACSEENEEIVTYLLSHGANPDHEVRMDDGATPDCYTENDRIADLVITKSQELASRKGQVRP